MASFGSLLLALFLFLQSPTPGQPYQVSLVKNGQLDQAATHGWDKIKSALSAQGIRFDEVSDPAAAQGKQLIVAGSLQGFGAAIPTKPESLLIKKTEFHGKQALLVGGSDDRGLMYGLLEVADRLGRATSKDLFSKVQDTTESPSVADRGVVIFTMQKHQYEDRLHDEKYWSEYFDTLAADRFNSIEVKFAYEANGYNCPVYPYYMDVTGFPDVKVVGLTKQEQQQNLADLHRLVRMAHQRGLRVTFGIWCHYYRFNQTWGSVDHAKPAPFTVAGVSETNLVPFTLTAISQFLKEFHEIDAVQLLMMDESGLKTEQMNEFWKKIYPALKEAAPDLQYELRAKGVSDDLVKQGTDLGLKIRINTKYWAEQVGLPFFPTHVQTLDQFNRRGGYADMLKYPREYKLHYTLWNSGTMRMLLWGDPDYVRRFAATTHLGESQGFEVYEPLATKMAGQAHDLKPFDLLTPSYRYYDYEFQRYWYFFRLFGRLTYNPDTPKDEWDHEFVTRFGNAAPSLEQGLQRASGILPEITAYCLPAEHYPTTRGWPERQRQGDLPEYVKETPSDTEQFESLEDAANDIVEGRTSPKMTPVQTSQWFAQAAKDTRRFVADAERNAGPHPGKEFASTVVDLKILAGLAAYHSHRVLAGLSYVLFEKTGDLNAMDDAIRHEQEATDAWAGIVHDAGDVYNSDLMFGVRKYDLSGHWRDELVKLNDGLAALKKERDQYHPEARRLIGKYDLVAGPVKPTERAGSLLVELPVPAGRYEVTSGIHDDKATHGPMWIVLNGTEYSDVFTVPAGQAAERTMETTAVDGKLKIFFDHGTSVTPYASTLKITRVDPLIAHVPVERVAPGQALKLRASVYGVAPIASVRVYYGEKTAELHGTGPLYEAAIPLAGATSYYLEATDTSGRIARSKSVTVTVTSDDQPPTLHHKPVVSAEAQHPLRITAQVEDPGGVKWVHLRYRGLSQYQDYRVLNMLPTGKENEYEATVPAADVDPSFDFMYFFEAMDKAGNGKLYPDMARETPYVVVKVKH